MAELPLLISLSTLLPIAAILVVVVTIVFMYRRLKARQDGRTSQQHRRHTVRAKYAPSTSSRPTLLYSTLRESLRLRVVVRQLHKGTEDASLYVFCHFV